MELIFAGDRPDDEIIKKMEMTADLAFDIAAPRGVADLLKDGAEVSVSFVSDDEIKMLNRDYRGLDEVTDVLSFPMYDDITDVPDGMPLMIGDVVIDLEQCTRQATEFGHSSEREVVYLFVHSLLHLLGFDHEDDKEQRKMRKTEKQIMSEAGL